MLLFTWQAGCGVAQRAGRGAAEGAMGKLAGKIGDPERIKELAEGVKRRAIGSVTEELGQPQRLGDIERIAAALGAGAVFGASSAASGMPHDVEPMSEGGFREGRRATPVELIAGQAARAFSQGISADLGRTGQGPLATSLSATTEQMAASMARGVRGELGAFFPACEGEDAAKCLDLSVERVSRASAAGVAAGIRESLGVWPLVLAYGVGVFSTLVLAWAWATYRAGQLVRR
ncbi:hypothetical protein [Polyangium fumosum]|uniref:Uncharacterized protein n=1 Tax=Polyangium fumosum TaxID=889272 RepID=A0A4U1JHY9_9BACT|nr:hypothetical protein [Polyangium fumosum]TKD12055.1 hypothetical protein E8A74_05425 [Polyangium fumosum]